MNITFPFKLDSRGRTAMASHDEYINQIIEQILMTSPGERVNRPNFGTSLMECIFNPLSEEMMGFTKNMVQGALQHQMAQFIQISDIDVKSEDTTIMVAVKYTVLETGEQKTAKYEFEFRGTKS